MAFFGLTALGPQEQFKAARLEAYTCELFSMAEFAQAFDEVAAAAGSAGAGAAAGASSSSSSSSSAAAAARAGGARAASLPAAKLDEVFRRVFHGPLPAPEADKVAKFFRARGLALAAEEPVARLDFLRAVEALRAEEAATPFDVGEAAHYSSSEMLREHRLRQVRPATGPEQIYTKSLTAFNEIGWRGYEQPVGYVRYPKKACEETKFLGELAKAGLI